MRLLKAFLVGATGLFIFITLLSLLIPANPRVSRTVLVNTAAKQNVYPQVADLKNWKNWHPVFLPGVADIRFGAVTSGQNASCEINYKSKIIRLTIIQADTAAITFTLKAAGENDLTNQVVFSAEPATSQIKVDWIATTHLHWYPWEKFYAIFIDKLTGEGYETALNNLKLFIETRQ